MRIVAGKHRSRRLLAPAGLATRPTAARAREALFSMLVHGRIGGRDIPALDGATVLDVFAGTGAFGFEALSRGAAFVTFVDHDMAAAKTVERNAAALKENDKVAVLRINALTPGPAPRVHDLAFFDPPYAKGLLVPALAAFRAAGWFGEGALIVAEMGADEKFQPPRGYDLLDERRYGAAKFALLALT